MSLRRPPLTVISGIGLPSGPSAALAGAGLAARLPAALPSGAAAGGVSWPAGAKVELALAGSPVCGTLDAAVPVAGAPAAGAPAAGAPAGSCTCAAPRTAASVASEGVVWAWTWPAVAPSKARQAKGISLLIASKKETGRARAAARRGGCGRVCILSAHMATAPRGRRFLLYDTQTATPPRHRDGACLHAGGLTCPVS